VWVVTKRGGYGVLSTASSLQSCCLNCSLQVGLKEKKITKDLIFKFFNYLFAHLLICYFIWLLLVELAVFKPECGVDGY
jgi:hypothetical protein